MAEHFRIQDLLYRLGSVDYNEKAKDIFLKLMGVRDVAPGAIQTGLPPGITRAGLGSNPISPFVSGAVLASLINRKVDFTPEQLRAIASKLSPR